MFSCGPRKGETTQFWNPILQKLIFLRFLVPFYPFSLKGSQNTSYELLHLGKQFLNYQPQ